MITRKALPRRTFLRGVGTAIGLPFLDAMTPAFAARRLTDKAPVRMVWVYQPNGMDMPHWTPEREGALTELPRILKPLEPFKNDMMVLSNLAQNFGRSLQDGPGDHARAAGSYLTGVHVYKTAGADIKLGTSCDQIAARQIGNQTKLPSLELGLEEVRQAGNCDSGYSCAYSNNLSWRSETQPNPPIADPRSVFERLFGTGVAETPAAREFRLKMRKSIIDLAADHTRKLQIDLGPTDRRKLDEYLSSVRQIELQMAKTEKESIQIDPGMEKPYSVPADFTEYYKLMTDMMAIALQADLTRIITFMVGRESSNRVYKNEVGVSEGHHSLTHHRGEQSMIAKVNRINCYHAKLFAGFVEKLKSLKEQEGTLIDNAMVVFGGGLADGNRHQHDQLPLVLVGRGGSYFKPGRHIVCQRETPMTNLYMTMLDRMGVQTESIGDSTGQLKGLTEIS